MNKDNANQILTTENTFEKFPNILTTKQLKKMLHIGYSTVLKLLHSGKIKSIKIGREYRIPKVYVIEYLNNSTNT